MYLKSIEVQGFKSFANKIVFEFHNGITGIVGPNGSGKSNVADAVRWVLGEQSAKSLRGGSMQDVIFSGTQNRRPLSYAYVAITLDNSDHKLDTPYEEVKVARRLYRSGESEYLMNGAACRLRDINELFYDTGIGKEGYSIIGQGQIDRILSTKPEETRELFDEATGIVKFKRRKNEAQKKLDEEHGEMLRIGDIIAELERQTGPLKKQSEKAREYLRKREDLKVYDVNLFLLEQEGFDEELRTLEEKADTVSAELEENEKEAEDLKELNVSAEAEAGRLDEQLDTVRDGISRAALEKKEAESRIELLNEQIRSAASDSERINARLSSIDESLTEKTASRKAVLEEKEGLDRELEEVSARTKEADEKLKEQREKEEALNQEALKVQSRLINILNAKASSKGRIQRLEATREQLQLRKEELDSQLQTGKDEEKKKQEILDGYNAEFEKICSEIIELSAKRDAEEKAYAGYRDRLGNLNTEIEESQAAYHREASRLESLRNVAERYEGYGSAVRKVMEMKGRDRRIHGVAADLIKTEKQYETAIETALGGNIKNVVVEDENCAKGLIAYLKANRLGRVTFLPLTSVRRTGAAVKEEVLAEEGVIGTADSLVSVSEKYKNVAGYLLGRTVVAGDIDTAVRIARKYKYSLNIVTLDGENLRPGGSITGGSYKNSENLIGRKRELDELTENVGKLEARLGKARARMESVKEERRLCRKRSEEFEERLQACHIEQNTAKMNVDRAAAELEELRAGSGDLKGGIASFEEQIAAIEQNRVGVAAELERYDDEERLQKEKAADVSARLDALKAGSGDLSEDAQSLHIKEAQLAQRAGYLGENLERLDGELESLNAEKEDLEKQERGNGADVREKEEETVRLMELVSSLEGNEASLHEEEESLKERRDAVSQKRRKLSDSREEVLKKGALLDKELYRLNSRREKLEEDAAGAADYMWQEYELTYNLALPLKNEEYTDKGLLKRKSQAVKDEIKALGDVNVNAIEDYKNVSERYAFMSAQRDDLVKAEASLNDIIAKLDAGMRRQFESGFSKLREEFDKAFRELFGGGKGTLELDTESDILEAGVRIIAQPPGKKLQNMLQLSGGEKALTAIALLFAIQNMKPSPFCLLDEIEAALDDSNVGRFSRYLHKLTKDTQFIIITHRKGTMEAADRLYGITMQEKGVSALVSVNLIEEQLDA